MESTKKDGTAIGRSSGAGVTDAMPGDWVPGAAAEPTPLAASVDRTLRLTAELTRRRGGTYQAAATLMLC